MNENLIKEKIYTYFSTEKYRNQLIPKSHVDISQIINNNFNITIQIDSDRNYSHSSNFLMILNPEFGILSGDYDYLIGSERNMLNKTKGYKHWGIYFKLSLIDNIACYIINSRNIVNNEVDIEECSENDIPKEVYQQLQKIIEIFVQQKWFITNFNILENEKRDWLNAILHLKDYQPNLADMLFGSFEFYSEANI